jgi:hypothetical protein
LGIAGSLGGIVTLFAISSSRSFRAAIDQASGVLMWRFSRKRSLIPVERAG